MGQGCQWFLCLDLFGNFAFALCNKISVTTASPSKCVGTALTQIKQPLKMLTAKAQMLPASWIFFLVTEEPSLV